nr:MAG: protein A [Sichuan sediment noda-like virus 7]
MIQIILGEQQITRTELLGGIAVVSVCGITIYGISKFWGYGAIAPYPESEGNRVTRALQRAVIDKSKTPIEVHFYPLDNLRTMTPRRANENGHAVSGAVRDAARRLISESISQVRGTKFELNPHPKSTKGARNHFHFAVGDLAQDFQNGEPDENAFIVGVDVDYYVKEPDVLLEHMRPVILHTFNPIKVSGFDADSPFTIRNNLVEYKVSGGAAWVHANYDWCEAGEYITSRVRSTWLQRVIQLAAKIVGLEKVGYHKIHHCRPWTDCPDRALVYTIPQFTVWRFNWINTEIQTRKLQRITYQDNTKPGWNRLEYITNDNKLMVSIGREGEHAQVTIEKEKLDMLAGLSATQSVNQRLISMGYRDALYTSMIVQYYTGKKVELNVSPRVYKPTMPRVHWPVTSEADVPEVSARQYTHPVISDSMMVPMIKRWDTMSESIERRVTFVANDKKPTDKIASIAEEFVLMVNGGIDNLDPYSIEHTIELLNKPSQQLQLRAVFEIIGVEPRQLIESFIKNEPGMKSARLISGFPDILFILEVSRFTLAYADQVLKQAHNETWYYPGKNPKEISDGVCDFVSDSDGEVIETDHSNMDGRVSPWCQRNIAQKAMVQAFRPEYRDKIISFMDTIINCPARAKRFGFRYEPGMGVKSGSPTTTPHNTLYNGCVEYTALKFEYPEATPEDLFRLLGPKCGDDGLARACVQKSINRAAKCYGFELKVERYNPEKGLCFLSRVFVDPLTTPTTIQDPLRTLRKLHLTTRDPTIPLADAACDRVEGYLCTDRLTPIISDYCRMVLRLYEPKASNIELRNKRRSRNKEKPYWLTCDGTWPQHPQDADLMKQVIINRTGIDEDDVDRLIGRFAAMKDEWEPITHDSMESNVCHTIDEEGVAPNSVDESFNKLNDAKQTRANSGTSRPSQRGRGNGRGHELRGRNNQRASGPRQPQGLPDKSKAESGKDGNIPPNEAKRVRLPSRKGTRGRGSNHRGKSRPA